MFSSCWFCGNECYGKERHVDHIIPYRTAKLGISDPNHPRNLWVLCRACHMRKTMAERQLFSAGREVYTNAIIAIAGRNDVLEQINDAFRHCGIREVCSATSVILRKTRKLRNSTHNVSIPLWHDNAGDDKLGVTVN